MTTLLEKFNKDQEKKLPELRPGDTIKVHQKIKEGDKERIQIFEGVIIARKHGEGINATITVRKVVDGVGVEKVLPIHSPMIDKIEIVGHGKVRRAKLNYLRTAKGIKSKVKRKAFSAAIAPEEAKETISTTTPADNKTTEEMPLGRSQTGEAK